MRNQNLFNSEISPKLIMVLCCIILCISQSTNLQHLLQLYATFIMYKRHPKEALKTLYLLESTFG